MSVLVDEAYADFAGVTLVGNPAIKALPNVFVGRTFAKAYGLAGIRAGVVNGDSTALTRLRRVVPPFSVNDCAVAALIAGLNDGDYYRWYLAQVRASKALLYLAPTKAGVRYWPSEANFVLAQFGERARAVVDGLAARGVHVRDKSRDPA